MQSFIITFCLVAAVILIVLSRIAIQASRNVFNSWIRVEDGHILDCKIKPRTIWSWPVIVYEYDAGDVRYIGEDTPPIPTLAMRATQFRQRYPPGNRLVVYVNPDNHQISTIAPDRLSRLGIFGIAAATICLMFAGLTGISGA
ncbi:MAG: DUF3592 domain-containing protein [Planctomycetia bacterium]|nr:DUF3592 domain-containing protein [Planctomycetia bacterium]